MDSNVLGALSAPDGLACSLFADQLELAVAVNGHEQLLLSTMTGMRRGVPDTFVDAALTNAGFPEDEEPDPATAGLGLDQLGVLALQAVTGLELTEAMFDDPWTGGITPVS